MKFNLKINYSKFKALVLKVSLARIERNNLNNIPLEQKVFCIGFGKTGTTSLELALKKIGYKIANQAVAEVLADDWHNNKSDRIINFCHTANAFQDIPFGMPGLYKELDRHFPNSKFILTVRDNQDQWYESLLKFHTKLFSKNGETIPSEKELKEATYRYKGWALDTLKYFFNYPDVSLYDPLYYKKTYARHNAEVIDYFKNRPNDLLVLNVSEKGSYQKLACFLKVKVQENVNFPWVNKT